MERDRFEPLTADMTTRRKLTDIARRFTDGVDLPALLFGPHISGIEVTQSIQYHDAASHLTDPLDRGPDNSVRLVALKLALVRVYVRSGLVAGTDLTGELIVEHRDGPFLSNWVTAGTLKPKLPGSVLTQASPDYVTERTSLAATLNFLVPGAMMYGMVPSDGAGVARRRSGEGARRHVTDDRRRDAAADLEAARHLRGLQRAGPHPEPAPRERGPCRADRGGSAGHGGLHDGHQSRGVTRAILDRRIDELVRAADRDGDGDRRMLERIGDSTSRGEEADGGRGLREGVLGHDDDVRPAGLSADLRGRPVAAEDDQHRRRDRRPGGRHLRRQQRPRDASTGISPAAACAATSTGTWPSSTRPPPSSRSGTRSTGPSKAWRGIGNGRIQLDPAKRLPIYQAAQRELLLNPVQIPLVAIKKYQVVRKRVKNMYVAFSDFNTGLRNVWLDG